jgi:hypothetical protein
MQLADNWIDKPEWRESDIGEPLGIPAAPTASDAQFDILAELTNKISWAIGSTYRSPYRNRSTRVRSRAIDIAGDLLDSEGYPRHLAK